MFSLFEEKKIKLKKCARAILDSDNKMPSCFVRIIFKNVTGIMWTVNSLGRSYISEKPLSKWETFVDIIINEGGDPSTGEVNGTCSRVAWAVRVDHVTVSKIWKQFCAKRTLSPQKNYRGCPSNLSYGDLCMIEASKREKPSISYEEILERLYEFGDLPYGTVSKALSRMPSDGDCLVESLR